MSPAGSSTSGRQWSMPLSARPQRWSGGLQPAPPVPGPADIPSPFRSGKSLQAGCNAAQQRVAGAEQLGCAHSGRVRVDTQIQLRQQERCHQRSLTQPLNKLTGCAVGHSELPDGGSTQQFTQHADDAVRQRLDVRLALHARKLEARLGEHGCSIVYSARAALGRRRVLHGFLMIGELERARRPGFDNARALDDQRRFTMVEVARMETCPATLYGHLRVWSELVMGRSSPDLRHPPFVR